MGFSYALQLRFVAGAKRSFSSVTELSSTDDAIAALSIVLGMAYGPKIPDVFAESGLAARLESGEKFRDVFLTAGGRSLIVTVGLKPNRG